jgi:hypothetical protein
MAGPYYNASPSTAADNAYGVSVRQYSMQYLKGLYDQGEVFRHLINFDADVRSCGESVDIPIMQALTAVDVTSSTGDFSSSYVDTSILKGQILINKPVAVPFKLTEQFSAQGGPMELNPAFIDEAGKAVSKHIDKSISALIAAFTTNSVGSTGSNLTESYLWQAVSKLVKNGIAVSNTADLVWVFPYTQLPTIQALTGYGTSYRRLPGNSISGANDIQPKIDTLFGIPLFYKSDSSLIVSAGATYGALMHRDTIGVAIQRQPHVRIAPITGSTATELLMTALYGVATLRQSTGCLIKSV